MMRKSKTTKALKNSKKKIISWKHPGGKMERLGPETLSDAELLAIIISSGIPGKSAEKIADDIIGNFGSF